MSKITDIELQASPSVPNSSFEQKDASSRPPNKKRNLRPRLWKAFRIIECHFMASTLHGYAIAHAQKAHLTRWDEVMIPDVENLVDWIKLFMSTSSERLFPWMNSTAFFIIAVASFVGYACWYFGSNKETDRCQQHILAAITGIGYIVALGLGFGPLIGTFCVAPRAVVVGLLVSDLAHAVVPGLTRRGDGEMSEEVESVTGGKS